MMAGKTPEPELVSMAFLAYRSMAFRFAIAAPRLVFSCAGVAMNLNAFPELFSPGHYLYFPDSCICIKSASGRRAYL